MSKVGTVAPKECSIVTPLSVSLPNVARVQRRPCTHRRRPFSYSWGLIRRSQRFNTQHGNIGITRGRDVGFHPHRSGRPAPSPHVNALPKHEGSGAEERRRHVNLKKIAGTAMIAGAVGAAPLGLGADLAQADPNWVDPNIPWIPGPADWVPGHWDPGLNWGPPGQVKKWCPWHSPPGHWIGGPHGIPCT